MAVKYGRGVEWIFSLGKFGQKPGLSRISHIMERLDNPQDKVNYVHVAGTNGKGSTSAYLAEILKEAGFKVGLFTSPFMETFNERININGENIEDDELESLIQEVKPIALDERLHSIYGHPTQFEIVTAIAFLYFARKNTDIVILEVGLGGRLDATNLIVPEVSVITNIALEHTDVLGETVEEIAMEKAGVIKPGVPVVTTIEEDDALKVVERKAAELDSPVYKMDTDFWFEFYDSNLKGQFFDYIGLRGNKINSLEISLLGYHQLKNASLAVAVMEVLSELDYEITMKSIKRGLKKASCPGRMEIFNDDPLILLDASHNLEGIRSLSKEIRRNFTEDKDIIILLGVLEDKEVRKMLSEVLPLATEVILTTPDNPRAKEPNKLLKDALEFISEDYIRVEEEIQMATEKALEYIRSARNKDKDRALVCCGSFFLVSPVRNYLKKVKTNFKFD